jgi:hypothetical protein
METTLTRELEVTNNQSGGKQKPTAKQYTEAFDSFATFLFEQYRQYKEELEADRGSKGYIISDMDTSHER